MNSAAKRFPKKPGRRNLRGALPAAVILTCALLTTGCLHLHRHPKVSGRFPPVPQPSVPIVQGEEGLASWYGHPYAGRPTASGEIYNMYAMTAAHRTLPFGTMVRVHNLENGRTVTVRINDRGPFVEGRIIDLSYAAAQAIHMPGVAKVRLEIEGVESGPEPSTPAQEPGVYAVQVGAFKDRNNAERLKKQISTQFTPVVIVSYDRGDGMFHRVRVGQMNSQQAAEDLARQLREARYATETFVVRVN